MNKKIGLKIIVMMLLLALVFFFNAIISNVALNDAKDAFYELSDVYLKLSEENVDLSAETVYAKLYMNQINAGIATGDKASVGDGMQQELWLIEKIRQTLNNMTGYVDQTHDEVLETAFSGYKTKILELCDVVEGMLNNAMQGGSMGGSQAGIAEAYEAIDALCTRFNNATNAASDAVVEEKTENIKEAGTRLLIAIVVYIVAAVVIVVVIVLTVAKPAEKASKKLDGIISKINNNEGDLTERIPATTKDEVGQLVGGVNGFMDQLQSIMQTISRESNNMTASVDSINERIGASNDNASDVSAAMEELSASMEEVAATLDQLSGGVAAVLDEAKDMSAEVEDGAKFVEGIRNNTKTIKADTIASKDNTSSMIVDNKASLESAIEKSRDVEQINELTKEILSISSQTNLLALNASIEAARAGEAGRGFAVVADEIRVLADNTRITANNIQQISENVTNSVRELASRADDMLKFVSEQVLTDYDKFVGVAVKYSEDADNMDGMLRKFREGAQNLANTVDAMSTGIKEINTNVDGSAKGVATAASSTNDLVAELRQISSAAADNKNIADLLAGEVNRFKKI